ncbi:hypothetical protein AB0I49_21470 [Streptomyces sp. NPDC050617]|uniref:Thoeris anti-defense Tad2 family protein n=1 Tax=Streptomyces sp. NPDC050617 TaxID=3154628 RepID=UPI003416F089
MDFSDALRALKAGRCMARGSWVEPGKYIYRVPANTSLEDGSSAEHSATHLFYRPAKGARGLVEPYTPLPYTPLPDALEAGDWYLVEPRKGSGAPG